MTSCRLQSNHSSMVSLHGGPVDFRPVSATHCLHRPTRVCSGYCMQEFDMAFHHNIMVKRKERLIVLMALNSPNDLYANDALDTATLRQYLRQYTYIDYTAEDWLDNLLYALPPRGMNQLAVQEERDVVLETAVLVSRPLGTRIVRSSSCSRSRRIGLGLFSRPINNLLACMRRKITILFA